MLVAGHCAAADAQAYSAYSDPGKTALSFALSKGQNVAELQREFGLADEEVGSILAAINEENGKLAREFTQSGKIVASNKSLSDAKIL